MLQNAGMPVSRKISLFGKLQRGRSPSLELFQLDMYGIETYILCSILKCPRFSFSQMKKKDHKMHMLIVRKLYNRIILNSHQKSFKVDHKLYMILQFCRSFIYVH